MSGRPSAAPSTQARSAHAHTPIGLVNNGVHVTAGNQPTIFSAEPVQVLRLPSAPNQTQLRTSQQSGSRFGAAAPAYEPSASERLFGASSTAEPGRRETTAQEMFRHEIVTMRQLQRALQNKITQNTRDPMGVWHAFHKLDRRGVQHLNLPDLVAAVRGFNLVASDE